MSDILGKFSKVETGIEGLFVIEPQTYLDDRGYFFEAYSEKEFFEMNLTMKFVQDNESLSKKGVIRGLHVQKNYPQGKLVRVVTGTIFDVVVDFRKDSPTFGSWYGVELSVDNKKQLYIPEGFAHGFYVKSEFARVNFKVTDYWHPNDEIGIPWNDSNLGIDWTIANGEKPIISEKDMNYTPLRETLMNGDNK